MHQGTRKAGGHQCGDSQDSCPESKPAGLVQCLDPQWDRLIQHARLKAMSERLGS